MKRWMKLEEAADYASIGQHRLKKLALEGKIKGHPDPDSKRGDWIFDRLSLDAYREGQFSKETVREIALEIMREAEI